MAAAYRFALVDTITNLKVIYHPISLVPKLILITYWYCNRLRLSICPLCYLLLNHWTKFNQICCVSYSHEWGVQRQTFLAPPLGPGEGSKGQIPLKFNYKVNFKYFYTKICVCSHKREIQTYQTGFSFCCLGGHAPGVGLLRRWGAQGSKKFKHGYVAYQIDGGDEQNRMQVTFLP